jgi:hypothetical protein
MMQGMQCLYIYFLVPIGLKVTMHWMTRKEQKSFIVVTHCKRSYLIQLAITVAVPNYL